MQVQRNNSLRSAKTQHATGHKRQTSALAHPLFTAKLLAKSSRSSREFNANWVGYLEETQNRLLPTNKGTNNNSNKNERKIDNDIGARVGSRHRLSHMPPQNVALLWNRKCTVRPCVCVRCVKSKSGMQQTIKPSWDTLGNEYIFIKILKRKKFKCRKYARSQMSLLLLLLFFCLLTLAVPAAYCGRFAVANVALNHVTGYKVNTLELCNICSVNFKCFQLNLIYKKFKIHIHTHILTQIKVIVRIYNNSTVVTKHFIFGV